VEDAPNGGNLVITTELLVIFVGPAGVSDITNWKVLSSLTPIELILALKFNVEKLFAGTIK
jgi:hypothetical protein